MQVRYNVENITSVAAFASLDNGSDPVLKNVYFIRCIGSTPQYVSDIRQVDQALLEREAAGNGCYIRTAVLPGLVNQADIRQYRGIYEAWANSGQAVLEFGDGRYCQELRSVIPAALNEAAELFVQVTAGASDSMRQNFLIKMIYWLDTCVASLLEQWNERLSHRLIYYGTVKKQEYLFLYLLTRLGIDVMLLHPAGELPLDNRLLSLSMELRLPMTELLELPPCERRAQTYRQNTEQPAPVTGGRTSAGTGGQDEQTQERPEIQTTARPRLQIPVRPGRQTPVQPNPEPAPAPVIRQTAQQPARVDVRRPDRDNKPAGPRTDASGNPVELSFEALAQLASSVVMIEVHDKNDEAISTGSGIMIGRQGYILTNCHVIRGGSEYGVRIEDDDKIYVTDELIKYNPVLDLALLRISRTLNPIAVYRGTQELARGQKVVAIGSPLGLFNSVSDGIISGFREFDHVKMIQFTAPISHGSSGGAVLNMYGDVIGISTSGFDKGQNINLAVSYKDILEFAGGFL